MAYMLHTLSVYELSDRGLVRQNNEDYLGHVSEREFYAIADGMGGHQAGEVASKMTVDKVCELVMEQSDTLKIDPKQSKKVLKEIIQKANTVVYESSLLHPNYRGMGTTFCCLLFNLDQVIYAHVGDSRIYRLRNGILDQLTQDHSLLREIRDQKLTSQYKHVLTRAIGTERCVEVAINSAEIAIGDIYLMCTDGLTDLLTNDDIRNVMVNCEERAISANLINIVKGRGAHDNITIVVIVVHETHIS